MSDELKTTRIEFADHTQELVVCANKKCLRNVLYDYSVFKCPWCGQTKKYYQNLSAGGVMPHYIGPHDDGIPK